MSSVRALVIAGPGTNRDHAAARALTLAGAQAEIARSSALLAEPGRLDHYQLLVIAGGFSHADALGAGRMLALELMRGADGALGSALLGFVDRGGAILGICNGFQVLTRTGLLPGALGHNDHGRFECSWVELEPMPSRSIWMDGVESTIDCPIAHGEGRYAHSDPEKLMADGQVALRYRGRNPNGSVADIAGVCDTTGQVMGLMPHPEDHVLATQHPHHHFGVGGNGTDHRNTLGLQIFRAGVNQMRSA
jgi:phosphoribosylformylglycinamidine synthase